MVISRTPFRISFFGGGTDYPVWFRQHGGAVLGTTIDKFCYLFCRYLPPFFEHRFRVVWSRIENSHSIDEIVHPVVREGLRYLGVDRGVEVHHDGDLPARSGMGSSASFTVGFLHAIQALQGRMPGKTQLARQSLQLDQEILQETVGCQDQILAAYGGFNRVEFTPTGEFVVTPVTLPRERIAALDEHLMLFYTGIKRTASDVAKTYVQDLGSKDRQLHEMRRMVDQSLAILSGGDDLAAFGELLDRAWQIKRTLSADVSNAQIDAIYATARAAGAIGGKVTGAGGGGFLLLFVPPKRQACVRAVLDRLIHVPFRFEPGGSQIIFFDQEEDYTAIERQRALQSIPAFRERSVSGTSDSQP